MADLIHALQQFVWGPGMLVFFLAAGVLFTVKSKGFQITKVHIWIKYTLGSLKREKGKERTKESGREEIPFLSFSRSDTALAATLGTGNITGVATALVFGGPGAVFWMWISAFLGMMTAYAENYLGIKYRYRDKEGKWIGGAHGLYGKRAGMPAPGLHFCGLLSGRITGYGEYGTGKFYGKRTGGSISYSPFFFGKSLHDPGGGDSGRGNKRIARITEKLVPVMAAAYLGGAFLVLGFHRNQIGEAFGLIFREAFGIRAAAGGAVGYSVSQAVRMGIARGIFSNEAGLGSSVMAHAQSDVKQPEVQGMWAILEIFIDTMVVCTVTALVILVSGVYQPEIFAGYIQAGAEMVDGTTLTGMAFETVIPGGRQFLAAASVLFAFATIIGWSYFGQQTAAYLGKEKGAAIYRLVYILLVSSGLYDGTQCNLGAV